MCEPVTIMAAMAVIAAGATAYSQHEQSKAQNQLFKNNQAAALVAQIDAYDSQAAEANQRRDAAGQAATQNALDAARARATASVAANDAGVAGLSIDALMNDISRQEGTNYSDLAANESYAAEQRIMNGRGIRSNTIDRINSVGRGNFNAVVAGLQIAGAGAQGYYSGKAIKEK